MESLPYPSFVSQVPVDASQNRAGLTAVGRCRINPEVASDEYRAIVAKNAEQAKVDTNSGGGDKDAQKKLKKKYMKEGVAMAKKFLKATLQLDVSVVEVEIVVAPKDLVDTDGCLAACLLDAGCQTIVTDGTQLEAMDAAKIPRERLAAHFTGADNLCQKFEAAAPLASSVSVELDATSSSTLETILSVFESTANVVKEHSLECVVQIVPSQDESQLESLMSEIHAKAPKGKIALVDPTARQLGLSYAAYIRTDREDKLYTTVVCTRNGEALGLVYSSKESIVASLECARGVYYSRSRNQLWRKGDTSGHYQTLHRLDIDCDGDAIRFTVTQRGDDKAAFCHLNTLTCWGNPRGVLHLQETLQDRFKSAPEGSYTKRLFDDPNLLREKLVEEAQELSEATEKDDVAGELADVMYFAMVRAVAAGVTFDDAIAELDSRSRKVTRRQGDSKAYRTEVANKILEGK
ncbi:biosynthesis trifunctional protein [Seminavis robusta]|uniref:Biosynthesis trifunctional protein n=1 Tax=Seminavis robusta TaxID=568900 RepID=A0A9N8DPM0_9STRA|nr:biosynthesis trifunctional protein [Seminavis robusta]|eukprot:Sro196_g083610.1 biosynthesis trifunctional protein (463) ;mRNA; f:71251-72738